MLSVSFTCLKSRQNKAGHSPIQLWVNVDGKRATTILSLRAAPQEFPKAMKSKQNNPILLYCNNVRERITEFFANSSYMGIVPTPQQIIDFVKSGFAVKQYMLYKLLTFEFIS